MKVDQYSLALVSLAGLAVAQPARRAHANAHHAAKGHAHAAVKAGHKGGLTLSDVFVTTKTQLPEVVVYLDKHGKPTKTTTELVVLVPNTASAAHPAAKTAAAAGVAAGAAAGAALANAVAPPLNQTSTTQSVSTQVVPAPVTPTSVAPTQLGPSQPPPIQSAAAVADSTPDVKPAAQAGAASGLPGVTYSPYNADGSCKSAGQVLSDFQQLNGMYSMARIYGTDCDQVNSVLPAAKSVNMKLMLGIFDLDGLDNEVNQITQGVQANGAWDDIEAVTVGNELVNNGQASPDQIINALGTVRSSLRAAGYQGPVSTVDTFVAMQSHPELCDNSDICTMNVHPFFDPNTAPSGAGGFVSRQVAATRSLLQNPNQRIVVTETGWPWQGSANGEAVPGKDNQQVAVDSIKSDYGAQNPGNLFLFTAFNDLWKKADPSTFYAEQYWGMNQDSS